jgi:hypothetical protein
MNKSVTFDPDRLPWLSEPAPKPQPKRSLGTAAIVALALAAGAAGAAGYTALQGAMEPAGPKAQVGPVEPVRLPPAAAQPASVPSEDQALALPAAPPASTAEPATAPQPSAKAPAARHEVRAAFATRKKPRPPAARAQPLVGPVQPVKLQDPSFSCQSARTHAAQLVCRSAFLASVDREMASLYGSAVEKDPSKVPLLRQSDARFLARRDVCSSETCVLNAYFAGIRNIQDIMARQPPSR